MSAPEEIAWRVIAWICCLDPRCAERHYRVVMEALKHRVKVCAIQNAGGDLAVDLDTDLLTANDYVLRRAYLVVVEGHQAPEGEDGCGGFWNYFASSEESLPERESLVHGIERIRHADVSYGVAGLVRVWYRDRGLTMPRIEVALDMHDEGVDGFDLAKFDFAAP
jgi:hypothetical protein